MKLKLIVFSVCLAILFIASSCQRAELINDSTVNPTSPTTTDKVIHEEPATYGNPPSSTPDTPTQTPNQPTDSTGEVQPSEDVLSVSLNKTTPLDMQLLVISAKSSDTTLEAVEALLQQVGVPYEVLIAAPSGGAPEERLTETRLVTKDASGNVRGRFQGIILTDAALSFNENEGTNLPESYVSAFSEEEWSALWQYERDSGVRQVALTNFPSTYPEDYGMSYLRPVDTTDAALNIKLTSAGQSIFSSLNRDISMPVRYAYTYLAEINATSATVTTPILQDAGGNIVGVVSTAQDGRERMALTMGHNPSLLHTMLLGYDIVNWVTQGVFIGERRMYLTLDVDDYFLESSLWNPATKSDFPHSERVATLKTSDIFSAKAGVERLRTRFPLAKDFNYVMAYNGYPADLSAEKKCTADATISEATLCVNDFFDWVSHTLNHELMDEMDYAMSRFELEENNSIGTTLGLNFDTQFLVTGNHSGLGWFDIAKAPAGATCQYDQVPTDSFCQFGLRYSNTDMLNAARDLGIKYLAANRGWLSHVAECDSCLIQHPLEPSIQLVPRWPTSIYYNVRTPEENMSEFNYLYGPNGVSTDGNGNVFFKEDQTWQQILEFEADVTMRHIMSASPYPHFFHQANIHEYAPGRSLLFDWSEAVLSRYSSYFNVPILVQDWNELTQTLEERDSFYNSSTSGVWNRIDNTVDVTSGKAATVFVTGAYVSGTESFQYGAAQVAKLKLSAGQSVKASVR